MSKNAQKFENEGCWMAWTYFNNITKGVKPTSVTQLYTRRAWVYEYENYYVLKSYNTVIAFIIKDKKACYDMLRYVYGYTATSAQHISKFMRKYSITKLFSYCFFL